MTDVLSQLSNEGLQHFQWWETSQKSNPREIFLSCSHSPCIPVVCKLPISPQWCAGGLPGGVSAKGLILGACLGGIIYGIHYRATATPGQDNLKQEHAAETALEQRGRPGLPHQ